MKTVLESLRCVNKLFKFENHIIDASCEYEIYGKNEEDSIPGPTDVQYNGCLLCDKDFTDKIKNQYTWKEVKINIKSDNIDIDKFNSTTWYYSKDFNKDTICKKYMGRIYFNGIFFWFEVSTK